MSELRRVKDSTVLPLNLAVKTLLLTERMAPTRRNEARPIERSPHVSSALFSTHSDFWTIRESLKCHGMSGPDWLLQSTLRTPC